MILSHFWILVHWNIFTILLWSNDPPKQLDMQNQNKFGGPGFKKCNKNTPDIELSCTKACWIGRTCNYHGVPNLSIPGGDFTIYLHTLFCSTYSSRKWMLVVFCFMKQNCYFLRGVAECRHASTPLSSYCINTTLQGFQMRYLTLL